MKVKEVEHKYTTPSIVITKEERQAIIDSIKKQKKMDDIHIWQMYLRVDLNLPNESVCAHDIMVVTEED